MMRHKSRNELLERPLTFGDKEQIKALSTLSKALTNGFYVDPEKEYFCCYKCKNKIYISRDIKCSVCGNVEDEDEHDIECLEDLDMTVKDQKVSCRKCKTAYEIKTDTEDLYEESIGRIIGLSEILF